MGGRRACPRSRRLPAGFRCSLEGAGAGTGQAATGRGPRAAWWPCSRGTRKLAVLLWCREAVTTQKYQDRELSCHQSTLLCQFLQGWDVVAPGCRATSLILNSLCAKRALSSGVAVGGTALNAHQPAQKNDFWDLSFPASTIRDHRLRRRGWGSAWPLLFLHSFSSHRAARG